MFYSQDPFWSPGTYKKAADEVGISHIQAYKWGYHQRIKNNVPFQKRSVSPDFVNIYRQNEKSKQQLWLNTFSPSFRCIIMNKWRRIRKTFEDDCDLLCLLNSILFRLNSFMLTWYSRDLNSMVQDMVHLYENQSNCKILT